MTAAFIASAVFAETKITMQELPPAVQAAVKELTKNVTVVGMSTEMEKGQRVYEIETKVNGLSRDLLLDKTGAVIETEEEVALDSIPAGAKDAIQKKAAGGEIKKVELLTRGGVVSYEAEVRKKGKNFEVGVNADGSVHD